MNYEQFYERLNEVEENNSFGELNDVITEIDENTSLTDGERRNLTDRAVEVAESVYEDDTDFVYDHAREFVSDHRREPSEKTIKNAGIKIFRDELHYSGCSLEVYVRMFCLWVDRFYSEDDPFDLEW